MTIMLPKKDDEARQIYRLARASIAIMSVVGTVLAMVFYPQISVYYSPLIAQGLLLGGVYIFLTAELTNLQYWFNRTSKYKALAFNRAQITISTVVVQMGLALLGLSGMWGLLVGIIVAQFGCYLNLLRQSGDLRQPVAPGTMSKKELAFRYRKMPLLNGPNAFIDSVRMNGIALLIGYSSAASLGAFQTAWTTLEVPIGLINGAIAQVYFQKMAAMERGDLAPLVKDITIRAIKLGAVPFIALWIIAPWIFPFVFGPQWTQAGVFARALTPWLFMQLISSPISNIFVVTERQQILLVFALFYTAIPLGQLFFLPWSLEARVYLMGISMATLLVINVFMAYQVALRYDSETTA